MKYQTMPALCADFEELSDDEELAVAADPALWGDPELTRYAIANQQWFKAHPSRLREGGN